MRLTAHPKAHWNNNGTLKACDCPKLPRCKELVDEIKLQDLRNCRGNTGKPSRGSLTTNDSCDAGPERRPKRSSAPDATRRKRRRKNKLAGKSLRSALTDDVRRREASPHPQRTEPGVSRQREVWDIAEKKEHTKGRASSPCIRNGKRRPATKDG